MSRRRFVVDDTTLVGYIVLHLDVPSRFFGQSAGRPFDRRNGAWNAPNLASITRALQWTSSNSLGYCLKYSTSSTGYAIQAFQLHRGVSALYQRWHTVGRVVLTTCLQDPGNSLICSALFTPHFGLKYANFWASDMHVLDRVVMCNAYKYRHVTYVTPNFPPKKQVMSLGVYRKLYHKDGMGNKNAPVKLASNGIRGGDETANLRSHSAVQHIQRQLASKTKPPLPTGKCGENQCWCLPKSPS